MARNIKKILICLLCLNLTGCALTPKSKKLTNQITELHESLSKNDVEIKRLQDLVNEQQNQLKEKDAKIEELRKKLNSFGVFE